MAITSVDSFVRIFKFYQSNPLVEKKRDATGKLVVTTLADKFKENSLIYQDTIDVYLHSLILDKYSQLSYDTDSDTIQLALNAREKLSKYFTKVLYPGSYAYSTLDNAAVRRMMLDWSSTIKTVQDANRRITNAYSLSSEDVDKAMRGFGIDFINGYNLKSIDRRKNFLLNICDLYSIKGSPASIIKALNIIGLEDIFLREAWLSKQKEEYNGDYDLRMKWEAQKDPQTFDEINKNYEQLNTYEDMYTSWDWFKEKIHENKSTFDPHWFYTKDEIKKVNNDPDVYMKLPSITPYFGIEYVSDLDRQIDTFEILFRDITREFQSFLLYKNEKGKTIWVDTFPNRLNSLECYSGLVYSLIRLDEHIQYENFKSYLESNKFEIPSFDTPYEYMNLIYWMYQNKDTTFAVSYNKLLRDYIPIKSNTYCSYENVLRWWLEKEVTDFERKGTYNEVTEKWENPFITDQIFIQPIKSEDSAQYASYIELEWDSVYPFGRYCLEEYSNGQWTEVITNGYIYKNHMKTIVKTDYADYGSEKIENFRIVIYHHSANIPNIFFHSPFNFKAQPTNTLLDRVIRYSGPMTTLDYYKNEDIKQAFINQQTANTSDDYDVISGFHESEALNSKIRVAEIHDDLKAYYSSVYNYPDKSKLYEDKWMNINTNFYNYVDWSIKDYYDTKSHDGLLESNRLENRKWPINKRWNWAVDSKYFYVNYEANKWMRCDVSSINEDGGIDKTYTLAYGDRFIVNNQLRVFVATNKWVYIDGGDNYIETDWDTIGCDLLPNGKIKEFSKLSRDLSVGQIKNTEILNLIYNDTILTDRTSQKYKDNIKLLNQSIIEVSTDPYGNELIKTTSYSYPAFLTYLYNSRLTLDFSTGHIYPIIEGYIDDQNRVYLKCRDDGNHIKWVRLNNKRCNVEWNSCDAVSIYDSCNASMALPPYSLPNRYDSLRVLDGRIFNYRKELLKASKNGELDDSVNLVVVRPYKDTIDENREYEDKYMNKHPVVYERIPEVSIEGSMKLSYTWEPISENRIQDCMIGVNPDLIDWIESMIATNPQNYVELPNLFASSLNEYLINELGIDGSILDLIIASWASNGVVRKIINYYKPKRARLLFVSNVLEGDYALSNGLDALGITDCDYNYYDLIRYRWGNPEFDKRNYTRINRQRIAQVIDDYLPVEDTIYKDSDHSNKVYNCRELFVNDAEIPKIEVYDQLIDLDRLTAETRDGNVHAKFYVNGFTSYNDDTMNGFYYEIQLDGGKNIYSNNSYYFEQAEFITKEGGKIRATIRWALFKANNNDSDKDLAYYVADRECLEPQMAKYGNCSEHNRFIDYYDFNEGNFNTNKYIKVGLRTIDPTFYFDCFDDEKCNGFYYHDDKMHPDRNGFPVYYNLNGKLISLLDTSKYYKRDIPDIPDTKCTKFWIISDYKQIIDFNECNYFAYTNIPPKSLLDNDLTDADNPDFTKQFYKYRPYTDDPAKDTTSCMIGCTVNFLVDHMDIVKDYYRKKQSIYDKYNNYRRNHFNQIEMKQNPIAAIVFDNGIYNADTTDSRILVDTDSNNYSIDSEGNLFGAIDIVSDNHITLSGPNTNDWSIALRILFKDKQSIIDSFSKSIELSVNEWHTIAATTEIDYPYYFTLINDKIKELTLAFYENLYHTRSIKFLLIGSVNLTKKFISTYLNAINNTDYTNYVNNLFDSVKSYEITPLEQYSDEKLNELLFIQRLAIIDAINKIPTITFNYNLSYLHSLMLLTGLTDKTEFTVYDYSSVYIDGKISRNTFKFLTKENVNIYGVNIKLCEYGIWDFGLNKWYINVINNFRILRNRPEPTKSKTSIGPNNYRPLFAIETPRTVYGRWATGLPENVVGGRLEEYIADNYKEKYVDPEKGSYDPYRSHEINPLWKNRLPHDLDRKLVVKGPALTAPSRKGLINDGNQVTISSDYRAGEKVQDWWMRYKKDYKTGAIHHRPVYISSKHVVNDPYPYIQWGQEKKGDYCDIGLNFDGLGNIDTSVYNGNEIVYRENTSNVYDSISYDENTGMGFVENTETKLENFGDTYKNKGSNDNIYVLDLDQLTLTQKSIENGILHEKIYFTGNDVDWCGEWIHKTSVESWKENDFRECYTKDNKEFVLTYQKESGYIWWEGREKVNDSEWITCLRTYVNAKHNQHKNMYVYDLLNSNQIDLCNQVICNFHESDYELFKTKCWGELKEYQDSNICPDAMFGANSWIEFNITKSSETTHPGFGNYFADNKYHMVFNDKWYCVDAEEVTNGSSSVFDKLPSYKTPSGYLYADSYLYIWYNNNWIRIYAPLTNKIKPDQLWKFNLENEKSIIINIIDSSAAKLVEETYVSPDNIDIRETFWKLIKFNGIPDYKWWNHMGEEIHYIKSVNNDISYTYTSIQDTLWYKTFEVDNKGEFYKVQHSNGIIDFVKVIKKDDTRIGTLKYTKLIDSSNV